MLRQLFEKAKGWFGRSKQQLPGQKTFETPYTFHPKAKYPYEDQVDVSWMDCRTKLTKYRRHRNTLRKISHESRWRNRAGV